MRIVATRQLSARGEHDDVERNSAAVLAQVDASTGAGIYATPTTLDLQRKHSYVLRFSSPGYAPATFTIHRDIDWGIVATDVLLTHFTGLVVDAVTGSLYSLTPHDANVTLTPLAGAGSEPIRARIGQTSGGHTVELASDKTNVRIEVFRK